MFENWPYTNFHNINLDWIMEEIAKIKTEIAKIPSEKGAKCYDSFESANSSNLPLYTVFSISRFDENREYSGLYSTTKIPTPLPCGSFFAFPLDMSSDGFGAYNNNNGDNSHLFQKLVDLGFPILLKNGIYYVSTTINAHNKNVYMSGYNRLNYEAETPRPSFQSTVLSPNGFVTANDVSDEAIDVHGSFTAENVEFAGNLERYSTPSSSTFANCLKQVRIQGCTFRQFAGFVKGSLHIGVIRNSLFCENTKGLSGTIYDTSISDCFFVGNKEHGVSLSYSSATTISNSKSEYNNDNVDFYMYNCTNVKVENCISDHNNFPLQMTNCKMCSICNFTALESKTGISLYNCVNIPIEAFCIRKKVEEASRPTYHVVTVDGNSSNVFVKLFFLDETDAPDFTPVLFTSNTSACNAEIYGGYQLGNVVFASGVINTISGNNRVTIPLPSGGINNSGVAQNTRQSISLDLYDTDNKLAVRFGIGNNAEGTIYNEKFTEFYGHIDNKNSVTVSFNTTDVGTLTYKIY